MIAVDPTPHLSSDLPPEDKPLRSPSAPLPTVPPRDSALATPLPLAPSDSHLITSPESFLAALITNSFDLAKVAASVPIAQLLTFIQDPQVLANIEALKKFSALCAPLHHEHLRSTAAAALTSILAATQDPIEKRRAATTLLRSTCSSSPPRPPRSNSPPPLPLTTEPSASLPDLRASEVSPLPVPVPVPAQPAFPSRDLRDSAVNPPAPPAPHPDLTPHQVIQCITTALTNNDNPEHNTGLNVAASFLADDTHINGKHIPVDDHQACMDALNSSCILGCLYEHPTRCEGPVESSPGSATCALYYPVPRLKCVMKVTVTLSRSAASRHPGCWLIASMRFEEDRLTHARCSVPSSSPPHLNTS